MTTELQTRLRQYGQDFEAGVGAAGARNERFLETNHTFRHDSRTPRQLVALAAAFVLSIAAITLIAVPQLDDGDNTSTTPASKTYPGNVDTEYYTDQAMGPTVVVNYPGRGNASPVALVAYRTEEHLCIELRASSTSFGRKQCNIPAGTSWPTTIYASVLVTFGERYVIGVVNPDVAEVQVRNGATTRSTDLTTSFPFPSLRFFVEAIDRQPITVMTSATNGDPLTNITLKGVAPLGPKRCQELADANMATASGHDSHGNAICVIERRTPQIGGDPAIDFAIYYKGVSVYGIEENSCSLPNRATRLSATAPSKPGPDGKFLVAGTMPVGAKGVQITFVDGTKQRVGVHALAPVSRVPVFVVKTDQNPQGFKAIGAQERSEPVPGCDPLN